MADGMMLKAGTAPAPGGAFPLPAAAPAAVAGKGPGEEAGPGEGAEASGQPVRKDYRPAIDLMRFVAAAGIVADHAMGWWFVGYPSLGLFLILTAWFGTGSFLRRGGPGFWASRARRMLVPWLFWCAVYRVVWEVTSHQPFHLLTRPFSLLVGPFIHLWFLPFATLALLLVPPLARRVDSRARVALAGAALAVLAVVLGLVHGRTGLAGWIVPDGGALPSPFPQWAFSLPIYLWGALAFIAHRLGVAWMALAAAAAGSGALTLLEFDQASWQLLLSALIFEAVWMVRGGGAWMTALARDAFGIYLMHPAFMLAGYKLLGPGMSLPAGFLIAFLGSWAATRICHRLPLLKRMV